MFRSLLHPTFKGRPFPPPAGKTTQTMTESFIVLVPGFGPGLWWLGSGRGDGGIAMKITIHPPTHPNSSRGPPTSLHLLAGWIHIYSDHRHRRHTHRRGTNPPDQYN